MGASTRPDEPSLIGAAGDDEPVGSGETVFVAFFPRAGYVAASDTNRV